MSKVAIQNIILILIYKKSCTQKLYPFLKPIHLPFRMHSCSFLPCTHLPFYQYDWHPRLAASKSLGYL